MLCIALRVRLRASPSAQDDKKVEGGGGIQGFRLDAIPSMTDSIQHSVLMIYKPYGLMIYAHLTVAMICNRFTVDDMH